MPAGDNANAIWHTCVASGTSGMISRLVVHPLDTIKARLCVQGEGTSRRMYHNTLQAMVLIAQKEGIRGLYSGFGAVAIFVVPGNMAYFCGYELGHKFIPNEWTIVQGLGAGAMAQLLGGLVYTPMDVVKERLQVRGIMGLEYGSKLWTTLQGTM